LLLISAEVVVIVVRPVLIEGSRDEMVLAGVTTLAAVVGAERKELGGEADGMFIQILKWSCWSVMVLTCDGSGWTCGVC
jgi:hypothetical protein